MTTQLIEAIGPNYSKFHDISYDLHDNVVRFINYFLRELHKSDLTESDKEVAYSFYNMLDNMVDKVRHVSEKINEFGCSNIPIVSNLNFGHTDPNLILPLGIKFSIDPKNHKIIRTEKVFR